MNNLSSGDIANLFQIPKSKLRYYIDRGLLTPKMNKRNGYYTFDETDIYKLYQLSIFRQIGFSIDEIKQSQQMDHVLPLLEKSQNNLQKKIDQLISLQKLTNKIIDTYKQKKLNEVFFATHNERYYKKFPSKIVKQVEKTFHK